MHGLKILGTGHYAPENIIDNACFEKTLDTTNEWITSRTGIKTRHISVDEPCWLIGAKAAENALQEANISPLDIDMIICSTVTSDYYFPSNACLIQKELGAVNAAAMDVSCACTGFIYALETARRFLIDAGTVKYKNILVVGSEVLSKLVDYTDRSTCILFGDGAGAAVVTGNADSSVSCVLGADGNGGKFLFCKPVMPNRNISETIRNMTVKQSECKDKQECEKINRNLNPDWDSDFIFQDGKEVYKFATKIMPYAVREVLKAADLSTDDIDMYFPHQANIRIIQTAAAALDVPIEKFYMNINEFGNTSS
ncbi:MAG: ketoacyl-ACP synthase III, partial [Oscillospiraceae bacterium]|nr:ketoacyl-ACP synthase III [Oscillospiraceae bacterium]